MPKEIKTLCFKSGGEWRKWLEANHGLQREVWLKHSKSRSDGICFGMSEAVEEALCFGWIDSKLVSLDKDYFALRYSPRKPNSVWSRANREKAERLLESGRMTSSGLALIDEAKRRGAWDTAYADKEPEDVPPDLRESLSKDVRAWANFLSFPNSQRNMYIRWVTGAKTQETRRRRIAEVTSRSASNRRPGVE